MGGREDTSMRFISLGVFTDNYVNVICYQSGGLVEMFFLFPPSTGKSEVR